MSYCFQMECRRWAPLCDLAGFTGLPCLAFLSPVALLDVGLTVWTLVLGRVGMRVSRQQVLAEPNC